MYATVINGHGALVTYLLDSKSSHEYTWLKGAELTKNPEGNGEIARRPIRESQDLVHVLGKQLHRFARAYKLWQEGVVGDCGVLCANIGITTGQNSQELRVHIIIHSWK
ncbi:hypothetical protein C8J57DRAFT_1232579 [Mycena rebaudengoi]|nr:hypothetical protein C8J57DRAFT_1232579 [Mycena rebaudengoi]